MARARKEEVMARRYSTNKGQPPNRSRTERMANTKDGSGGKKGEPPNQKRTRNRAAKVAILKKNESLAAAQAAERKRKAKKRTGKKK